MQTDGVRMVSQTLGQRAQASDSSEPSGPSGPQGRPAPEAGGVESAGAPAAVNAPAVQLSPDAARRAGTAGDAAGASVARPVAGPEEAESLLTRFLASIRERPESLSAVQQSPTADAVGTLVS